MLEKHDSNEGSKGFGLTCFERRCNSGGVSQYPEHKIFVEVKNFYVIISIRSELRRVGQAYFSQRFLTGRFFTFTIAGGFWNILEVKEVHRSGFIENKVNKL